MTALLIMVEAERGALIRAIERRKLPFVVTIAAGKRRTILQNRLQRKWMLELEAQGDMTAEEYRGYCKLHFGVPIMRNESEEFRRAYDRYIRDLPYEHKLAMMMVPLDFPVTRGMSTKQKTVYLDSVYRHFTGEGFVLTVPQRGGV